MKNSTLKHPKIADSLITIAIIFLGFLLRITYFFMNNFKPVDVVRYRQVSMALFDRDLPFEYTETFGYPIFLKLTSIFTHYNLQNIRLMTIVLGIMNIYLIGIVAKSIFEYYNIDNLSKQGVIHWTRFLWATSWISIFVDNTGYTETFVITLLMLLFILLYNNYSRFDYYFIILIYIILAMTRQEYQIFSFFIGLIFYFEGVQFDDQGLKKKAILIVITGIFCFILWSWISYIVYGSAGAVADLRINNIVNRNSPNVETGGLMWYIFEYHGLVEFLSISLIGFGELFLHILEYMFLPNYILMIFGVILIFRRSRITFVLFALLGLGIHSFNLYEWDYVDGQRLTQPYLWPLFIVASLGLNRLNGFEFQISPTSKIWIKRSILIGLYIAFSFSYTISWLLT